MINVILEFMSKRICTPSTNDLTLSRSVCFISAVAGLHSTVRYMLYGQQISMNWTELPRYDSYVYVYITCVACDSLLCSTTHIANTKISTTENMARPNHQTDDNPPDHHPGQLESRCEFIGITQGFCGYARKFAFRFIRLTYIFRCINKLTPWLFASPDFRQSCNINMRMDFKKNVPSQFLWNDTKCKYLFSVS